MNKGEIMNRSEQLKALEKLSIVEEDTIRDLLNSKYEDISNKTIKRLSGMQNSNSTYLLREFAEVIYNSEDQPTPQKSALENAFRLMLTQEDIQDWFIEFIYQIEGWYHKTRLAHLLHDFDLQSLVPFLEKQIQRENTDNINITFVIVYYSSLSNKNILIRQWFRKIEQPYSQKIQWIYKEAK